MHARACRGLSPCATIRKGSRHAVSRPIEATDPWLGMEPWSPQPQGEPSVMTQGHWRLPSLLARRISGALVLTCLCVGAVQAADSGPRHHARGEYDAATATYVVAAGDDLDAIGERFEIPVVDLMRENQLDSTLIEVGQALAIASGAAVAAEAVASGAATGAQGASPKYSPDTPRRSRRPTGSRPGSAPCASRTAHRILKRRRWPSMPWISAGASTPS